MRKTSSILRLRRRRVGLTIAELSALTGISSCALRRYELNQRTPDAARRARILLVLDEALLDSYRGSDQGEMPE